MTNENRPDGRYIVDLRIFLLSMTVAMSAAFFAGVTMGPGSLPGSLGDVLTKVLMSKVVTTNLAPEATPHPPPLNLSPEVIAESYQHAPSGQHLLVDLANVQAAFLDSEERLTHAMVETVKESGLTMLSYHCHKLMPAGISCVGVLLESHISFHTWPEEGVITLDLFTCGKTPLLPKAVETMQRLFGIPRDNDESQVRVKWSHELRGFRPEEGKKNNVLDNFSDLSLFVLSPLDLYSKTQIYSNLTKYQRVDLWDVVELDDTPSHEDAIKHNLQPGDPRWSTPEIVTPARLLFVNGYLIRDSSKDIETHEALTHPAMFAHPNPKHVAIVGGREGGCLREVLKHNTVQSVRVIEKDEELVRLAREFLPRMSDCSDLMGRAKDCFEDELVTVTHEDPQEYFPQHYSGAVSGEPLLDVIIMDDKDPRQTPELYSDADFVNGLVRSLSEDGVLVIHAGLAPDIDDPRADKGNYAVREQLINFLERNPLVHAMTVYEEARTSHSEPTAILVVCRSASCRSRFYARSDQVDFQIYERIVRTHSKERALQYFDGTTQYAFQVPPKAWETVYCRREPTPFECAYTHLDPKMELHDLDLDDETKSSFRIVSQPKQHAKGDEVEDEDDVTFVFATKDIPKGSYIMPKHMASSLVVTERNLQGLYNNLNVGGGPVSVIEDLLEYIADHGHASRTVGTETYFVEIGGSVLMRTVDSEEEANVGRWVPPHPSGHNPVFSPVYERHRMSFDVFLVATKDIPAGTEVLRYKGLWKQ